jgi:DNA polymerase III delta prime subunit
VHFIFATTEVHKIPVTILSRCQRFDFRRISHADIVARLSYIVEQEELEIPAEVLHLVARQAAGGMRDALSQLDQIIAFAGPSATVEQVAPLLGAAERSRLFAISRALLDKDLQLALETVDEIAAYGGLVSRMPIYASFFMLFTMANAGLPATSGFVGEFMVILGAVKFNFWIAAIASTTLIFGAAYSLWMFKRVVFGETANEEVAELKDVASREFWMLAALAVAVLVMGLWPKPFTDVSEASVRALLEHVAISKIK